MSRENRALVASVVVVAALALVLAGSGVADRFELPLRDRLMRMKSGASAESVAVIAIDDASLAEVEAWPWPRGRVAGLVDAAFAQGAIAVAVDLLLVEPSAEDDRLAASLGARDSMLLVSLGAGGEPLLPPAPLATSAELVHGVLELDGDGVLRRLSSTKQTNSASYTAMSLAAAARIRHDLSIPVGRELVPAFPVRPDDIPLVRASDLIEGRSGSDVSSRVAFIGVTATGLGDRVITPVTSRGRLDPGVVVHAALTEALARGALVTVAPPWIAALMAGLLVLAAWMAGGLGGRAHVVAIVLLILVPSIAGTALLATLDLALPIVLLTGSAVAGVLLVEARTLLSIERGVGRATRTLGAVSGLDGSPAERIRRLELLAGEIASERRRASESQRAVAHELRTPLTSIRGLAKLLAAYELSEEERKRVAGMVAEESTRLHEMVEGLLDLERLALRDRNEGRQRVDVAEILSRRAELATAVGTHEIAVDCHDALPMDGASDLLSRMVENLVGNAMKFSPAGSTVVLRGRRRADEVEIEVEDEGPGIPVAERERVLRRFGRASSDQPGLGLGLAFVSEIARWHGGSVAVDEGPRGGACLRVRLPGVKVEAAKESIG